MSGFHGFCHPSRNALSWHLRHQHSELSPAKQKISAYDVIHRAFNWYVANIMADSKVGRFKSRYSHAVSEMIKQSACKILDKLSANVSLGYALNGGSGTDAVHTASGGY